MDNHEPQPEKAAGEMSKRREKMADERRYIIFYTFGDEKNESSKKVGENV